MTFAFEDCTVTTWALRGGRQIWRVRDRAGRVAEFEAPRDARVVDLHRAALEALATA